MTRIYLVISVVLLGLFAPGARADTFKLATGETITGDLLPTTANDQGVQVKVGEGEYQRIPWASFSQEDLKKMVQIPRLEQYAEPFIEITAEERLQKTQVNIRPPPRLARPSAGSVLQGMFSSLLGVAIVLGLYGANLFAGYEIAFFRSRPVGMVCGVSAVLPVLGPIIFLALPPPGARRPREEYEAPAPAPQPMGRVTTPPIAGRPNVPRAEAAPRSAPSPSTEAINPMQTAGVQHPEGLRLAHSETEPKPKPAAPQPVTYQRGQYTFNRRFFETKFPGFFGVVKRDADRDMVLMIRSTRGQFVGERITHIAANDLHLLVESGGATQEVMIPFLEIQEIRLQSRGA